MTVPPAASPASGATPDLATSPTLAADLDRAHRAARALLGCDHLAADAVQEALVALWRQPNAPPDRRGWLVRAVVHRARHLRRSLLRRRRHECAAGDHCDLHSGCDNPLHQAHAHELGERLDAAVATLPREQRAPFELYVATGLDYRGIASELGLPIGTVRSRLHRARAALQALLHDDAPEPAADAEASAGERAVDANAAAPATS